MDKIRVRAALSPTGKPHLGTIRTALFNYLFARAHNGVFFVRIDDTDRTRTVKGSRDEILKTIEDFGMSWDEEPVIQSDRLGVYTKAAETLLENGSAYYCFCSSERLEEVRKKQQERGEVTKYDRKCAGLLLKDTKQRVQDGESAVIRMRVPDEKSHALTYKDYLRGEVTVQMKDVDDQVLLKADGFPTYHLANVVDDHDMDISHVIRADEWLPSTPKHVLLFKAFNWDLPIFVHVPLIVNANKKKLSKRDGDFGIDYFLQEGYVLGALRNYIAFLGWRPKEAEQNEFYSLVEMEKLFSLDRLQKSPAVYDIEKLNWFNAHYIKEANAEALVKALQHFLTAEVEESLLHRFLEVERERLITLKNIDDNIKPFAGGAIEYDTDLLVWKKMEKSSVEPNLEWVKKIISEINDAQWKPEEIESTIRNALKVEDKKVGEVLWPLRVALSGLEKGPSPFACLYILGKENSLKRIKEAISKLK